VPESKAKIRRPVTLLTIDSELAGQRIDNYLLNRLKGVPKSHIYKLLRKGEVRVNKGRIRPQYRLAEGDQLRIPPVAITKTDEKIAPAAPKKLLALIEESVLYEDEQWLVVDKPAELAVHGGSGLSYGLIEIVRQLRPKSPSLELCHRLDRATSGCLVLAKKRSALRRFHQALRDRQLEKHYCALVVGRWPAAVDAVNVGLRKNVLASGERMVFADTDGKPSQTRYGISRKFQKFTLVDAFPVTGRTHQIRVHCREAGHPIVGDEKYGNKEINQQLKANGFGQLFLHAYSITVPGEKKLFVVESKLPTSWQRCFDMLSKD